MFATWKVGILLHATNTTGAAFTRLSTDAETADERIRRLQSSLNLIRIGAAVAMAEIGKLGVQGFMSAADHAGKLQQSLLLVAQQTGASAVQMDRLYKSALQLSSGSSRTLFDVTTITNMARVAQQSGLTLDQIIRPGAPIDKTYLGQLAYAAELEKMRDNIPAETTARSLSLVAKGYGLADPNRQDEMERFIDTYARVSSQTHLRPQDLQTAEQYLGPVFRTYGGSPEDFVKIVGWASQQGFRPSTGATSLANFLTNANPRVSMTASKASAQFASLMMLGQLTPVKLEEARKLKDLFLKERAAMGLPADLSQMTAKQQEGFANVLLSATARNKLFTSHGHITFADMFAVPKESLANLQRMFGPQVGSQMFQSMITQAENIRGSRMESALARGDPDSFSKLIDSQENLTIRIGELRYTFEGMKISLPQMLGTIATELGGIKISRDAKGNVVIGAQPGGPLDIMLKVMRAVTDFLGRIADWGAQNQEAMAAIGTLMGVLGVGMLVGATALATVTLIAFTRQMWLLSGIGSAIGWAQLWGAAPIAAEGAARGGFSIGEALLGGSVLASRRAPMMASVRGLFSRFFHGAGDIGSEAARMSVPGHLGTNPAAFGARYEPGIGWLHGGEGRISVGSKIGAVARDAFGSGSAFAEMGESIGRLVPVAARFGVILGEIGLRFLSLFVPFLDIVMVIWLIRDAIAFLHDHAFDMGRWAAIIVHGITVGLGFMKDVVVNAFLGLANAVGTIMSTLWNWVLHPGEFLKDAKGNVDRFVAGWEMQQWQFLSHDQRANILLKQGYGWDGHRWAPKNQLPNPMLQIPGPRPGGGPIHIENKFSMAWSGDFDQKKKDDVYSWMKDQSEKWARQASHELAANGQTTLGGPGSRAGAETHLGVRF